MRSLLAITLISLLSALGGCEKTPTAPGCRPKGEACDQATPCCGNMRCNVEQRCEAGPVAPPPDGPAGQDAADPWLRDGGLGGDSGYPMERCEAECRDALACGDFASGTTFQNFDGCVQQCQMANDPGIGCPGAWRCLMDLVPGGVCLRQAITDCIMNRTEQCGSDGEIGDGEGEGEGEGEEEDLACETLNCGFSGSCCSDQQCPAEHSCFKNDADCQGNDQLKGRCVVRGCVETCNQATSCEAFLPVAGLEDRDAMANCLCLCTQLQQPFEPRGCWPCVQEQILEDECSCAQLFAGCLSDDEICDDDQSESPSDDGS